MPRPRALTEEKKREILALVSVGTSKTLIAQYVGCSVSAIYNERRRDAEFRTAMERSAAQNVLWLKQSLRRHTDKSWRAAAWLLEREYPHLYAQRPATAITPEDAQQLINTLWELVARCPYKNAREWMQEHSAKLFRSSTRFAAAHAAPWERDARPHSTDLNELDDLDDEQTDPHPELLNTPNDPSPPASESHPDRAVEPDDLNLQGRWQDRTFTYRDQNGVLHHFDMDQPVPIAGGEGNYDMERLRDAVEFATPQPNPMAAAWVHYCQELGISDEEKTRLEEAYRQQRETQTPSLPDSPPAE